MKKPLQLIAVLSLSWAGPVYADGQNNIHEMLESQRVSVPDDREELRLPEHIKVKQKRMMRGHMSTLSDITAALAKNDLKKAAETARGLGWTPEEEEKCSAVSDLAGEEDFLTLGMAVHRKADELASAAGAGDRDKALYLLAELIDNCNACHHRFRH